MIGALYTTAYYALLTLLSLGFLAFFAFVVPSLPVILSLAYGPAL